MIATLGANGGQSMPIGLPILFAFDYGEFDGSQEICQSVTLPNDQALVGTIVDFASATFPDSNPSNISISSAFEVEIID